MLAAAFGDLFVSNAFIVQASLPHGTPMLFSAPKFAFMAPQCLLGAHICLSGTPSAFMATHLPYGAPHASRRPNAFLGAQICLSGTPSAFMATHLP
jgi:hypothetical protein